MADDAQTDDAVSIALDAVERAVMRLEQTVARYSDLAIDQNSLAQRHSTLRAEVTAAVAELDQVIGAGR